MAIKNFQELFQRLIETTSTSDIKTILDELGDYSDVGLNKQFGNLNLQWYAYGGNEYNIGTIGVASKSGRSLTERITNAIDAILEERFLTSNSNPTSPQRAASDWFGRPVSGPDSGLYQWQYQDGNYDKKVFVILNPSENKEAPTIDIIDSGIGIQGNFFPDTILSLQQGNKMRKKYLAGAFGQGGSSTLKFCDYVLVFSRHKSNLKEVSFTLIKKVRLDDDYKEDCFAYLAAKVDNDFITVPSFNLDNENALNIHKQSEKLKAVDLKQGTVVRHYGFRLTNLFGSLAPQSGTLVGNLYHYLHYSMFDTLIPFRLIDQREATKERDEIVTGSRNRLMAYANKRDEQTDDSRTQLRHYRTMEYVVPSGSTEPCIGIEYWVVFNYEKKKNGDFVLRSDSNALFVQRKHPIIFTLNGQNQGELSANIFKKVNLPLVSRHIVVHVDCSKINKDIRTNLFATNREGLVEEAPLESIKQELERMLQEDKELENLEKELVEKITSKETDATDNEVKRQITKLLVEAGFSSTAEGTSAKEGNQSPTSVEGDKKKKFTKKEPLPTLPFPNVTKFKIVSPQPRMEIRLNDTEVVLIETDADSKFKDRIAIRFEPNTLEYSSHSPLSGGRTRWRVRPTENAKAGDKGKVIVTLTKPDGSQMTDEVEFEVFAAVEKPSKPDKGIVPPFEIRAIEPSDPEWNQVWENIDEASEEVGSVAYKQKLLNGVIWVFYSKVFSPFKAQSDKLKLSSEAHQKLFVSNYEVWIGLHAILQYKSQVGEELKEGDEDVLEQERESERARVAQIQVKQALSTSDLIMRLSKHDTSVMIE